MGGGSFQRCPKPLGKDRGSLNGGDERCRRVDHSVQVEVGEDRDNHFCPWFKEDKDG